MRNNLSNLNSLLPPERLENLRRNGVMFFDVDDTLLARRTKPSENDQVFSESQAAISIPLFLNAGIRVCVITGHGWKQLQNRFVLPLIKEIFNCFPKKRDELLKRFFVYANRGATKIIWKNGTYSEETDYINEFSFDESDLIRLLGILSKLEKTFNNDFAKQKSWYLQNFPKFAFNELPPQILEREKVVLGLRPIPSEAHCKKNIPESPRQKLFSLGYEAMKSAGLDVKYEITQSGKSTLEITNKEVSKKLAFQDLIFQIAKENSVSPETVEKSSIYVGDEFNSDGNDYIISQSFPHCLYFSVASIEQETSPENVIFLHDFFHLEGVPATTALMTYVLKVLT